MVGKQGHVSRTERVSAQPHFHQTARASPWARFAEVDVCPGKRRKTTWEV